MIGTDRSVRVRRRAAAQIAVSIEADDWHWYSDFPKHSLDSRIAHNRTDWSKRNRALLLVLALSYILSPGNGVMSRIGGEMSNFTTGITPRYWARTMGCELPDWPEGVRGCANRTSVIAPKQNRTPIRRRSLKNAD